VYFLDILRLRSRVPEGEDVPFLPTSPTVLTSYWLELESIATSTSRARSFPQSDGHYARVGRAGRRSLSLD